MSPCPFPTTITTTPRAPPEYLIRRTARVFLSLMRFLRQNLVSSSFFLLLRFSNFFFHLRLLDGIHFEYSQVLVIFLFSKSYDSFMICHFYSFYFYNFSLCTGQLVKWVECSPMVQETRVQSQVESYQRLKKWYLMLPCLTHSFIKYVSRVKWSNPGKGVVPFPTPRCSSYWKKSLRSPLTKGRQLYLLSFSLWVWHTFLCQIPFLYSDCIFLFVSYSHDEWWNRNDTSL